MLETFYNNFGFVGSIFIAAAGFILFIFWIAGIAGLTVSTNEKNKTRNLIIAALFPPYPLFWLLYDMVRQKRRMQGK